MRLRAPALGPAAVLVCLVCPAPASGAVVAASCGAGYANLCR